MLSMAVQPNMGSFLLQPSTYPSLKLGLKPLKASTFANPKRFPFPHLNNTNRIFSLYVSSPQVTEAIDDELSPPKEKLEVGVKPMQKPRLVLKFIWMEKNIGLGLEQHLPGHGAIPLSPYYFWPRKDAWEELKVLLESKPWISQKQMIILLNQATDIINLWQQSGANLAS